MARFVCIYVHMCIWHVVYVKYVYGMCHVYVCVQHVYVCMCMVCGVCMRCIRVSVDVCTPVYMCEGARTGHKPSLFAAGYMETYLRT